MQQLTTEFGQLRQHLRQQRVDAVDYSSQFLGLHLQYLSLKFNHQTSYSKGNIQMRQTRKGRHARCAFSST
jgi:hypothetical protein